MIQVPGIKIFPFFLLSFDFILVFSSHTLIVVLTYLFFLKKKKLEKDKHQ